MISFPRGNEMFQFPPFAPGPLCIQRQVLKVCLSGFPHSEISGSKAICASPKLIAAYRVLHRRQMPRHPPCALVYFQLSPSVFQGTEFLRLFPLIPTPGAEINQPIQCFKICKKLKVSFDNFSLGLRCLYSQGIWFA